MTPAEVKAMTAAEYIGFLNAMDMDIREQNRQIRKAGKGGR